jgi:exonuclease SbcC
VKLHRLAIQRLPGIDEPFALEDLGEGLHVIVGPNGIGKSSLCRAARALLWSDCGLSEYMEASALFDRGGERWRVEREGSRHRWQRDGVDAEAPPLPAAHLDGCFFLVLRDLLDASSDVGSDLAGAIRRQMSGGFDLERAAARLFGSVRPRHGRKERGELDQAERNVRTAGARQAGIAQSEEQLADLERAAAEAEAAQHRLAQFERVLEVHAWRARLAQVEAALEALPEALGDLTGGELEQLEQRETELEEKLRRRREAESEREAALEAVEETRLAEPLDPAALATWRERADGLADLETRLDRAQEEWKACRRAAAEAGGSVGGRDDATPAIDLAGDADLFAFLRAATSAEYEWTAIGQRLQLLEGRSWSDEDRQRLYLHREGVEALRDWLRASDPAAGPERSVRRRWCVAVVVALLVAAGVGLGPALHSVAALLVAAGVGLGPVLHPVAAVLLAAGLSLAGVLWLLRPEPGAGYARGAAEREFPADVDPPSSWTADVVRQRLRQLEPALAELEAAWQRARDRGVERADLENKQKAAQERQPALEQQRRELASRLALDEIPENAELVDMARALDQLRQARAAEAAAGERVRHIGEEHRARLSELSAEIVARGEAEPTDAASARTGVGRLKDRDDRLRSARTQERNAGRSLQQLDGELTQVAGRISEIYQRAGLEPGDRAGLARLLEDLERHRRLRGERDGLVNSIRPAQEKQTIAGELELIQGDRGRLEAEKRQLEEQAGGLNRLRNQIAEIGAEVKRAREGHDLEDALARQGVALGQLEERRREALQAEAGRLLLDAVGREHETNQMPRVLERARELFATFTHHAYELQVAPGEAGSFVAVEARSGAGRRPHELSDGTRAQLLLAARLAFAEEAEQGARLPLFLDEALDQSDPVRFRAIARSLGRMVEDQGRQIFYLSNDPTDAQRIQEALEEEGCAGARVIDLAAVRNRAAGVPGPEALRVDPLPQVPAPSGHTPESYGATLMVPPLDPRRDPAGQHLFYLLWDDLPLLHRLLESRIEHVGQWLTLSRSGAALAKAVATAGGIGSQLGARAELLEAFCRAWREGRGSPVDRAALEQSGAVSPRYLEDVVAIARELGGDGERLIEALRDRDDPRLQGFRTKATNALEAFLTDEGHMDPRPTLDESEIVIRILATPAADRLPETVATECAHRWWSLSL